MPSSYGCSRRAAGFIAALFILALHRLSADGAYPPRGAIRFYNAPKDDEFDGYVRIPNNPPAQRCYSFSCSPDRASFVKWYEVQEEAWLVFFDEVGCKGKYARVFGPDGKKKLSDLGMDDKVASFMLWESGMYPTRGIVDLCFIYDAPILIRPSSLTNHADDIPSIHHNGSTTGIDIGIDGDDDRGTVQVSDGK